MILDIKGLITGAAVRHNVMTVSINGEPEKSDFGMHIFSSLAQKNVCVDMISVGDIGGSSTFSFIASDKDLFAVLEAVSEASDEAQGVTVDINSSNCIVSFEGRALSMHSDAAEIIFGRFAAAGIRVKTITSSRNRISCLIDETDPNVCVEDILDKEFGIKYV